MYPEWSAAPAAAAATAPQVANGYPLSPNQSSYGSPPPQQPPQPNTANRSTSTLRGGMATGYVPYANIYGGPTNAQQNSPFSPPPSDVGSVQPNFMNQVAPPVAKQQDYHQNPYAQEAPVGSQPGYIPDPYYTARRHEDQQRSTRNNDKGHNGDDSDSANDPRSSRSTSRKQRPRRDDYSPSTDSYDSHSTHQPRRTRSERRPGSDRGPQQQQRGKSGVRGAFDTSQRGLGYSAVGALAGGLIGSEVGKGPLTKGLGAVVGALGANLFEARERYGDHNPSRRRHSRHR